MSGHTDPVWFGSKVLHLSERDNLANLCPYDPSTKQETRDFFERL